MYSWLAGGGVSSVEIAKPLGGAQVMHQSVGAEGQELHTPGLSNYHAKRALKGYKKRTRP